MSWNIDRTMGLVHHDARTAYEGFTLYSCVRGDDWEASRLAGVKRVIQASSGNTIRGWDSEPPYDALVSGQYDEASDTWPMITHDMVRPLGVHGATKICGEALGRHFSDAYGMSVLCVQIGAVRPEDRPREVREYTSYLSHRDVVQML